MDKIKVLGAFISDKISAGEVVENPASVVKECIENSIDADSNNISIYVKDAGVDGGSIRIVDNGIGMSFSDALLCFKKHATSKIESEDDLFGIGTLGFRGEALASIASVSSVVLKTKERNSNIGTEVCISGSKLIKHSPVGCPDGTSILIENIFYNTPARLKYLKKVSSETLKILNVVYHYSLAYPNIRFKVVKNTKTVFLSPGDSNVKNAFSSVYGHLVAKEMILIKESLGDINVNGLISKPPYSRRSRNKQIIFLNGRLVKNQMISKAIENAYKPFLVSGEFAVVVLDINIPLNEIDVNVHPQKLTIRLSDEKDVYNSVYYSLKKKLNELIVVNNTLSDSLFQPFEKKEEKVENLVPIKMDLQEVDNPLLTINKKNMPSFDKNYSTKGVDSIYALNDDKTNDIYENNTSNSPLIEKEEIELFKNLKIIGQSHNLYIILQNEEGLVLIDQHAMHERIIYEKIKKIENQKVKAVQTSLVPIVIELSQMEKAILENNIDEFNKLGIEIEEFGIDSYAIRSIPYDIKEKDVKNIINDVISSIREEKLEGKLEKVKDRILKYSACRSAIKAGQSLNHEEISSLINDFYRCYLDNGAISLTCPHGRPIILELKNTDLDKKFKRVL